MTEKIVPGLKIRDMSYKITTTSLFLFKTYLKILKGYFVRIIIDETTTGKRLRSLGRKVMK